MRAEQPIVKIFGHRGTRKYAPENTIPAFQIALDQGADGFELDTMLTGDGIPVVIHDRSLKRTTSGTGFVDRTTADEIRQLDAGSWFSDAFHGVRVPLLEEVLSRFSGPCEINIELKNIHAPFDQLPEKVCALVVKYQALGKVLFSSFVPFNLVRVKRIEPKARVALLVAPDLLGHCLSMRCSRFFSPDYIHPHFSSCSEDFISAQRAMGRVINTWTVNEKERIISLINKGIDGVITDDPLLAVSLIRG